MALDFAGVPNTLFDQSAKDNLGIGAKGARAYWSSGGNKFHARNPDTDQIRYSVSANGNVEADANGIIFDCPIEIPEGALIDECIVYGNAAAAAETWLLTRVQISTGGAGGTQEIICPVTNINTSRKATGNTIIDNQNFFYVISTSSLDTNDEIFGVMITYTT